eukprot:314246-Pyramimonas_sp.AAC.1
MLPALCGLEPRMSGGACGSKWLMASLPGHLPRAVRCSSPSVDVRSAWALQARHRAAWMTHSLATCFGAWS